MSPWVSRRDLMRDHRPELLSSENVLLARSNVSEVTKDEPDVNLTWFRAGAMEVDFGVTDMTTIKEDRLSINAANTDALMYIVVVLGFYALAMVVLMVKYVRRENQESELSYYFSEFIKRDRFQCAKYQNQRNVKAMKEALASRHVAVGTHATSQRPTVTLDGYEPYSNDNDNVMPNDNAEVYLTDSVDSGTGPGSQHDPHPKQLLQRLLDKQYIITTGVSSGYTSICGGSYTAAHGDVQGLPTLVESPCDETGVDEREEEGDMQSAV